MTERTIEMLHYLEKGGYKLSDLADLIKDTEQIADVTSIPIEKRVGNLLRELGMLPKLNGYEYTKTAICLVYEDITLLKAITKRLYPQISRKYGVSVQVVEKNIRIAVENVFNVSKIDFLYKFFGQNNFYEKGRPTNSQFISSIVEYLKMEEL